MGMSNNKSARDWAIFMNINNERFSDVERMTAIEHIAYAPTHNSITKAMMLDVIRYLLTAQQPRVIPLKELADEANHCFDVVWHEVKGGNVVPRRVQPCGHMLKVKSFYTEPFLADGATYNVTWRCWTARPTEEQRETTQWDEP